MNVESINLHENMAEKHPSIACPSLSSANCHSSTLLPTATRPTFRCSLTSIYVSDSEEEDCSDSDSDEEDDSSDEEEDDSRTEKEILSEMWQTKALALCNEMWPSNTDTLSVNYLNHGSFNTVFSISMSSTDAQPIEYVLRIPNDGSTIARTVSILEYLANHTNLKAPKVITWDASGNNPLETGYIILSRVPGRNLEEVWDDLSHDHKLLIAQEMARFYCQIESFTNPIAGVIKAHSTGVQKGDDLGDRTFVEAFGASTWYNPTNPINWLNADDTLPPSRLRHDQPHLPVKDIMLAIFKRRRYQAQNSKQVPKMVIKLLDRCQNLVENLVDLGLFRPQGDIICLSHTDLFPRNIMVDFTPEPIITAILDWDDAMFVPRFAGRAPPQWLWRYMPREESEHQHEQLETFDPKINEPDSPQNAEIKKAFEDIVGESWISEAMDKGYSYARRLFGYGIDAIHSGADAKDLMKWLDAWESSLNETPLGLDDKDTTADVDNTNTHKSPDRDDSTTSAQVVESILQHLVEEVVNDYFTDVPPS
ncbi:hypothetical protein M426DRAFT_20691 [Hypoxylon sp. CI-4A]|nr:hypothetical protein M426DRAFT_20691 [Hypoxylon sp. CI-4A]